MNNTAIITRRQYQVLRFLQHGYTYEEVAKELRMSPRTAKSFANLLRSRFNLPKARHLGRLVITAAQPLNDGRIQIAYTEYRGGELPASVDEPVYRQIT